MKNYLMMIVSTAVFSSLVHTLTIEKWEKYLRVVTGILIINVILSPVFEIKQIDFFNDYEYVKNIDTDAQKTAVCKELERRVSEDAQNNIFELTGEKYKIKTVLSLNKNHEITGVKEMVIWTNKNRIKIQQLLYEIYSPAKISFR